MTDDLCQLVNRCLAGEQPALLALVERFRDQVFGLCFRMLGQREDAEDVAQETFVRALKSLHRWDSRRRFEPWLLAIAGNRCRTLLKLRARRATTALRDEEQLLDRRSDVQSARNLGEELRLALGTLRPEYRQAFLLFHEHQLSYEEIAEAMECPLGTVRTWIHRARRDLMEALRSREVVEESRYAV